MKSRTAKKTGTARKPATRKRKKTVTKRTEVVTETTPTTELPATETARESTIVLDNTVVISNISQIRDKLLGFTDGYEKIVIDMDNVEMIDTAGLQLLTSFIMSMKQKSVDISWQGESAALRDTARLLGLTKHLSL